MALSPNINSREMDKFALDGKNKTASKVQTSLVLSNKLVAKKTTITTDKTKIQFPEQGTQFRMYHVTSATNVWISNEFDVAVSGDDSIPLPAEKEIVIEIKEGSEPDIFGIVGSSTVDIYVYGSTKE